MEKRRLGQTDILIAPLVLGTNVMGWTADEATSFAVMDAFVDGGFSAIDTADVYSRWVPGNHSESEKIIGRWLKARGNRDRVHIFTKVGSDMGQGKKDLSAPWIRKAVEDSLSRLQTDVIDLYQSHWPDPTVEHEETLRAYEDLIASGKVRAIGASNYDAGLLRAALAVSEEKNLPRYQTLQNELNLVERGAYDAELRDLVVKEGLSLLSYYSLASGFLTGKYRSKDDLSQSQRGGGVEKYLDARGLRVLAAMDTVAERTGASHAAIALAWINAQPGVAAPIASATSVRQLEALKEGAALQLSGDDIKALDEAGA
ncbi:MAG: alcohol dehydrogenase [Mesorhizobium amorphae]|nr:MAG: alcohol dehydrogenase [Mesorhizobium amorphae]